MVAGPLAVTVVTAILRCEFCAAKLTMQDRILKIRVLASKHCHGIAIAQDSHDFGALSSPDLKGFTNPQTEGLGVSAGLKNCLLTEFQTFFPPGDRGIFSRC